MIRVVIAGGNFEQRDSAAAALLAEFAHQVPVRRDHDFETRVVTVKLTGVTEEQVAAVAPTYLDAHWMTFRVEHEAVVAGV